MMIVDKEIQYQGLVNIEEFIPRAITQGLHYTEAQQNTTAKAAACYREAMGFFVPPAQPVEIPFEGINLAGFFRLPPACVKSPCMIFINGVDGTKLEFHNLEVQF